MGCDADAESAIESLLAAVASLEAGRPDGGEPVTPAAIGKARQVLPNLAAGSWGAPRILPTPEGGILAEWTFGDVESHLSFRHDGSILAGSSATPWKAKMLNKDPVMRRVGEAYTQGLRAAAAYLLGQADPDSPRAEVARKILWLTSGGDT